MGRIAETDWLPRLETATGPKYLAIVEAIADAVASGALSAGDRLPPQRELAKALSVDLTTVTRSFAEAQRRGLLDARVGSGSFVRGASADILSPTVVDMSMNMPPQPADARLRARIARSMSEIMAAPDALTQLHYQDSAGIAAHRAAAASWLSPRLGDVPPERVAVASGAQSALAAILDLNLSNGDTLCAPALTYPGLKAAAERGGYAIAPIAMDDGGLDPDAFEDACRRARPRLLYLVPTIDNPTTATLSLERRQAIAAVAERHGVTIVEDDAYGALASDAPPPIAALAPELCWHIASLSKCATPALRIAYVATPDREHSERFAGEIRSTSLMASPLTSALAARWAHDGTLDAVVGSLRRENSERQKIAARLFGDAVQAHPEGHHLWLSLPSYWRRGDFVAQALHSGLSVVPSDVFATGDSVPEAVRVSIGVVPDHDRLERALQRLAALLARRPVSASVI